MVNENIRKEMLTRRYEAVKVLRGNPDMVEHDIEEIIREWELSGLFRTGCPRCGSTFYWVPPDNRHGLNVKICSVCLYEVRD